MNLRKPWYILIPIVLLFGFLAWTFRSILIWILIAAILSFIGQPLVKLLGKIHYKKIRLPRWLNALIVLLVLMGFFVGFFSFIIPLLAAQAETFANLDYNAFSLALQEPVSDLDLFLKKKGLITDDESISLKLTETLFSYVNAIDISSTLSNLVGLAGTLFIAIFSVLFITFFFLKDEHLFYNGIMLFTPIDIQDEVTRIINNTRKLLSRYFTGLLFQLISIFALVSTGMYIIGLENALVIGLLAGIFNVVPYVGPIIGGCVGILLGISVNLDMDYQTEMLPLVLSIATSFVITNLIDNIVLQPLIFSKSVKAHPLEIFLVIMMAGSLGGFVGMIVAIPSYTFIRIVAKEFLKESPFVKKLTSRLDEVVKK